MPVVRGLICRYPRTLGATLSQDWTTTSNSRNANDGTYSFLSDESGRGLGALRKGWPSCTTTTKKYFPLRHAYSTFISWSSVVCCLSLCCGLFMPDKCPSSRWISFWCDRVLVEATRERDK